MTHPSLLFSSFGWSRLLLNPSCGLFSSRICLVLFIVYISLLVYFHFAQVLFSWFLFICLRSLLADCVSFTELFLIIFQIIHWSEFLGVSFRKCFIGLFSSFFVFLVIICWVLNIGLNRHISQSLQTSFVKETFTTQPGKKILGRRDYQNFLGNISLWDYMYNFQIKEICPCSQEPVISCSPWWLFAVMHSLWLSLFLTVPKLAFKG